MKSSGSLTGWCDLEVVLFFVFAPVFVGYFGLQAYTRQDQYDLSPAGERKTKLFMMWPWTLVVQEFIANMFEKKGLTLSPSGPG